VKKLCVLIGLLCLSILTKGQSNQQAIVLGHVDTVYSEVLKEKRPILIYSPSYDTAYFSKPAYPVLYVLDGEGYFASLVTMIQQLSVHNGNTTFPQMIIVGIPNLRGTRNRDFTPSPSSIDPKSGGGEAFTTFLEKELIPYIDNHYATAPYRTLIGHSLGGLMVVNTLLEHPSLFNAYVALDPSMSYDQGNLLKQTRQLLQKQSWKKQTLFLGIANTMDPGMDTVQVRSDTTLLTYHIRSILKLKDDLTQTTAKGLHWSFKYYCDDDHASVPLIGEYDALRFIFRTNRFPHNQPQNQYFDKNYSVAQLKKAMDTHYRILTNERGYEVKPPEPMMNHLGYSFLQQKDFERAFFFFETNVQYYPNSFNVYDGLGDYYLAIDKKTKAIDWFKKALKLKNTLEIRDKLQKLSAK
jgi:predicted alpha/beta superfamily hydrolase